MVPAGVDICEDMSLQRSQRIGFTTEVLNRGLDTLLIEANNIWINSYIGRGRCKGLSMVAIYTKVENALGIHLIYS